MATQHIRNPFEMIVAEAAAFPRDVASAVAPWAQAADAEAPVTIRTITTADLKTALREGLDDLGAVRADVLFIGLVYAVAGVLIARAAFNENLLPLVFPLVSGFALVGPVAALGLYEISRRREAGETVGLASALGVFRAPGFASILALSGLLLALLLAWLLAASAIYAATLGPEPPESAAAFANDVLTTMAGWTMIVVGVAVGFVFAATAFAISVVSFPLLLERPVGVYRAIGASIRAVRTNPTVMMVWAATLAGALVLGSVPALLGLIVVLPLLGHASWRLYRKLVAPV